MAMGRPTESRMGMRFILIIVVVLVAFIAVGMIVLRLRFGGGLTYGGFYAGETIALTEDLHDLGVVDIDGDGNLDVYSINHSSKQLILINEDGKFEDRIFELGLSQSRVFPGLENSIGSPDFDEHGLYLFWQDGAFCIRSNDGGNFSLVMESRGDYLFYETTGDVGVDQVVHGVYRIELSGESEVRFRSRHYYFRPHISLDLSISLSSVFIGSNSIKPKVHAFPLPERDRHGMAWTDFDDDGDMDVFVTRGGDAGRLADSDPEASDEFFFSEEGGYMDRMPVAGIEKLGMPARSVQWVDINQDGLLDLYLVNGRKNEPNKDARNQLFVQKADGSFADEAKHHGLDIEGEGIAVWYDADQDFQDELLWCGFDRLVLYKQQGGVFVTAFETMYAGEPRKTAVLDIDGNGSYDCFIASREGNRVLMHADGGFRYVRADALGLPKRSRWVTCGDFDNDGRTDLHLLPQGIFERSAAGTFESSGQVAFDEDVKAMCTWFDADNDGDLDLLVAYVDRMLAFKRKVAKRLKGSEGFWPEVWRVELVENRQGTSDWLQVELLEGGGSRPAIGGHLELLADDGSVVARSFVGQFEGALRSQGHYRMYFGIDDHEFPLSAVVTWGDRSTRTFTVDQPRSLVILRH